MELSGPPPAGSFTRRSAGVVSGPRVVRNTGRDSGIGRSCLMCERRAMVDTRLVVCEGDETGQELLEQSLRVFDVTALGYRSNWSGSTCRSRTDVAPATPSSTRLRRPCARVGWA